MKFKRIAALAVGAVLMLGAAGCSGATTENESAEEQITSENTESVDNGDGTRTIIDQVGNEVVLPEKIERVVIASVWPLASVYVLSMGTDKLVGLDPAIISAAENSMLIKIAPEISEIESGFSQNGFMNAEELIKLDPDVVLYSSGVPEDYEVAS